MSGGLEELRDKLLGYVLKNAVQHGGKAAVGPVMSMILGENPELRAIARELVALVESLVKEVNNMSVGEQRSLLESRYPHLLRHVKREQASKQLPPLPNADKYKVIVTRFAPNPDFALHLGNARPAILSHEYARLYKGRFILRFEDTDPRIKRPLPEAFESIKEDLKWLGITWDAEYIQSLRLEIYYDVARKLIEKGGAYVDLCPKEEFSKLRDVGRPCPHRSLAAEDQLELWERMLSGSFNEGEAVLRVKTDLKHPDPSVRDWVAFRVIDTSKHPHPLTGDRYVVWPTYNFAAAVDDHLLGVTHILRGKEHATNTIKQKFLYEHLGWKYPETIHFGRLRLEGFIMSKSRIRKTLEANPGAYRGFADIRFGTLAGLRSRGFEAEAIKATILEIGVKHTDAKISFANLASINRKLIDPRAHRLMFVSRPVPLKLVNLKGCIRAEIPFHPSNTKLGARTLEVCDSDPTVYVSGEDASALLTKDGAVRLMELANVRVKERRGRLIEAEIIGLELDQARELGLRIIQWVPRSSCMRALVKVPKGLSLKIERGLVEGSIRMFSPGSKVQLVRYAFVKVENVDAEGGVASFVHIHE